MDKPLTIEDMDKEATRQRLMGEYIRNLYRKAERNSVTNNRGDVWSIEQNNDPKYSYE